MTKPVQQFSFHAFCKSFAYAVEGILFVIRSQRNMFLHLLAAIFICVAGLWLNISSTDWRWLIVCIAFVWFAELINSAFEFVCDVVMPELHDSVKRAKDIAAGAVLICAIAAAIIGVLTFWPYL